MELSTSKKLFYFFPVLFCFCLPFGSLLLSIIIFCWTLCSFFVIERAYLLKGLKNPKSWWMYAFFIATLLSALFSENKSEMLFSLEVKMTFVIFPYLLFCFHWPADILKRCLISFVSGCFFASVFLLGRALLYSLDGHPEYFFYTRFSEFLHASYFSMYLMFAIVIVVLYYPNWFKLQRSVIASSYFFVAIFITTIFLCSSKLGIVSALIVGPFLLFYKLRNGIRPLNLVVGILVLITAIIISLNVFPEPLNRIKTLTELSPDKIDKNAVESSAVRLLIWEQSFKLISENLVFGVGVADANDELYEKYSENGLTGAFKHKLNAHNQYLQTFIGMGLLGFFILFRLTIWPMFAALREKKIVLFLFLFLTVINFLVESMLQTSAGVLFFAFFYSFFNLENERELV